MSSFVARRDSACRTKIELLKLSGRAERAIDTLEHCHMSSYRPSRSGEWNSDVIVVELSPTQLELFFLSYVKESNIWARDSYGWPCRPLEGRFLIEKPAKFSRNSCISILLWGPSEHADIFCSKIEKLMKQLGPGNGLHRFEFAKVAGPSFGCLENKRLIEACLAGPYAIR